MPRNLVRTVVVLAAVLFIVTGAAGAADTFVTAPAGSTYETDSGLQVTPTVDHGVPQDPFDGSDTVVLSDATFTASGPASLNISQFNGTRTELSSIDASSNAITIDPDDKSQVTVSGGVTALSFSDAEIDGTTQFNYSASSSGTITLTGLPANTDFAAATPGGTVLDTGTTDASGTADISVSSATDRDVILLEPSAPQLSNGSPSGNETTRFENETLSIDVADADFATDAGDDITLEWSVNGSTVGTTTVTSNGTATFDVGPLPDGTHNWSVTATDSYGETTTSSTYEWTISHRAPQPDNANAEPSDGTQVTEREITFSVPVEDADFAQDGDEITATFYLDGEQFGTDTLTSNGTASATTTVSTGGNHTWYVEFSDEYGLSTQTDANTSTSTNEPFEFQAPSELRIYNESDPGQLLDNTSVTVEFYYENGTRSEIVTRNASNGTVDFAGLPVDQSFIAVIDAPGYLPRRIFIGSLIDTQRIFLLPESADSVEKIFEVEDFTGRYPEENTVVIIQRSLNGSWQNVQGDYLGATGEVTAQLAENERHRIIIRNTVTGAEKRKGEYTPLTSSRDKISIYQEGDVEISGLDIQFDVNPSGGVIPAVSSVPIDVSISQAATSVDSWSVDVVRIAPNGSETTLASVQNDGDTTSDSVAVNLSDAADATIEVRISYTDTGGETGSITKSYSISESFNNDSSLLEAITAITAVLPSGDVPAFTTFLSILGTALATGAVAVHNNFGTEASGVTALGGLLFFGVIGWIGYQILFAAFATFLAAAGLRRGL
jgi:hypothetical protein